MSTVNKLGLTERQAVILTVGFYMVTALVMVSVNKVSLPSFPVISPAAVVLPFVLTVPSSVPDSLIVGFEHLVDPLDLALVPDADRRRLVEGHRHRRIAQDAPYPKRCCQGLDPPDCH